jgi:hypothetical protein
MTYAIETLEIEKSRLIKIIREFQAMPVIADERPTVRIADHSQLLREVEEAIVLLQKEEDARQLKHEQEMAKAHERSMNSLNY